MVMHGKSMKYMIVAAVAVMVGLLVAGTPVASLLPFALVLACPLMMVAMMGMMSRGHGQDTHDGCGHEHGHGNNAAPAESGEARPPALATTGRRAA
jgi:DUF2933 family protein